MSDFYYDLTEKIETGIDFAKENMNELEDSDNPTEDDVRAISRNFNLIETYFSAIDRNLKDFYEAMGDHGDKYEQTPFELFEGLTEQYFALKDQFADIIREVQRNEMQQQAQGMGGLGGNDSVVDVDFGGPGPS